MSGMKALFEPRSVALVGASSDDRKLGSIILSNMIEAGYEGGLYPINPKASEIQGLKAYPTLSAVPGPVDLAVI